MKSTFVLFTIFTFLEVIIAAASTNVSPSERIVGGTAASTNYPFMVSLREVRPVQPNEHFCAGFVWNNRWIVTTAHCLRNRTPAEITAHMGTNIITDQGSSQLIIRFVIHENYDWQRVLNNIAMVQSAGPIVFTALVGSITIAEVVAGTPATVTGWGVTAVSGNMPETLQVLQVENMSREACLARHSVVNQRYIYENTTCSTSPVGQGLCAGDGGSPLFIGEGANRQVVGIASWNMPCGTAAPDVYVRLSSYQTWIGSTGSL